MASDELDIAKATMRGLAKYNLPMNLPWFPKTVKPGAMVHSDLFATSNPFSSISPFDEDSLRDSRLTCTIDDGAIGSYVSATTLTKGKTLDHLSLGLGVEVECIFARASVAGQYDQDTTKNTDGYKTSMKNKFNYGTILFQKIPKLSMQALITLKHPIERGNGLAEFQAQFGDYYIAGYRLGGETGVLLSQSSEDRRTVDIVALEAKVEVLCFEKTYRRDKRWTESSASSDFQVCGYDTLDHVKYSSSPAYGPSTPEERERQTKAFSARARTLEERVMHTMRALGVVESDSVGFEVCEKLCRSGLVMELILLPVTTLREVMLWATDDDII